jgi:hypothetical protein
MLEFCQMLAENADKNNREINDAKIRLIIRGI